MKTWAERIDRASETHWYWLGASRGFRRDDTRAAVAWNTCALGEAAGYPRSQFEAWDVVQPEQWSRVSNLGMDFLKAVQHDHYAEAESILREMKALIDAPLIAAIVAEAKRHATEPELAKV